MSHEDLRFVKKRSVSQRMGSKREVEERMRGEKEFKILVADVRTLRFTVGDCVQYSPYVTRISIRDQE